MSYSASEERKRSVAIYARARGLEVLKGQKEKFVHVFGLFLVLIGSHRNRR